MTDTIIWDHDLSERFDRYVTFTPDCWTWIGYVDPEDGYGRLKVNGVPERVHRLAYERWKGALSDSDGKRVIVDHQCHNRRCVNPDHLQLTTYRANAENSDSPIADNMRKEACERGHPFTPENTYTVRGGRTWPAGRACRVCRREWMREYRATKKAEAAGQGTTRTEPSSSPAPASARYHRRATPTAATA